jgi:hypothetical protein
LLFTRLTCENVLASVLAGRVWGADRGLERDGALAQ